MIEKSDFEAKKLLQVKFRINNFAACQILGEKYYSLSDFELKSLHLVRF